MCGIAGPLDRLGATPTDELACRVDTHSKPIPQHDGDRGPRTRQTPNYR